MEDNFVEQVRTGNIEEVETRLKFEDINCKNKKGVSGLYVACQMNNKRMVDFLITNEELNVNAYNKTVPGHTALMIAAELGHADVVKTLLKHPQIQVNITSAKNWTALMYASFFGHEEVVQWLCYRKEIDLTIKGPLDNRNRRNEFFTARDLAEKQKKFNVLEILDAKMEKQPYETEVGLLLKKQALEKYAKPLFEHQITTVESGTEVTVAMLEEWGIFLPPVQKRILELIGGVIE